MENGNILRRNFPDTHACLFIGFSDRSNKGPRAFNLKWVKSDGALNYTKKIGWLSFCFKWFAPFCTHLNVFDLTVDLFTIVSDYFRLFPENFDLFDVFTGIVYDLLEFQEISAHQQEHFFFLKKSFFIEWGNKTLKCGRKERYCAHGLLSRVSYLDHILYNQTA